MKAAKVIGILLGIYVAIVVVFESLLGYYQPQNESTLVLTTFEGSEPKPRVLTQIDIEGQPYVAVNHWPRQWYNRLQENPEVEVTIGDVTAEGYARVVTDQAEFQRLSEARPLGLVFRILTGFPPRYFVRLDLDSDS